MLKEGEKRKVYRGLNQLQLEANIVEDIEKYGWIVVSESTLSNNPEWVMEVIYLEK